jgi:hypothetical protein
VRRAVSAVHVTGTENCNGYETWFLTLTREHGLKLFGNRVLRKILGPKRVDIRGDLGKLTTDTFYDLYFPRNVLG